MVCSPSRSPALKAVAPPTGFITDVRSSTWPRPMACMISCTSSQPWPADAPGLVRLADDAESGPRIRRPPVAVAVGHVAAAPVDTAHSRGASGVGVPEAQLGLARIERLSEGQAGLRGQHRQSGLRVRIDLPGVPGHVRAVVEPPDRLAREVGGLTGEERPPGRREACGRLRAHGSRRDRDQLADDLLADDRGDCVRARSVVLVDDGDRAPVRMGVLEVAVLHVPLTGLRSIDRPS